MKDLFELRIEDADICIKLKKLDRKTYEAASGFISKGKELDAAIVILKGLALDESKEDVEKVCNDFELLLSASSTIGELIQVKTATLKKI